MLLVTGFLLASCFICTQAGVTDYVGERDQMRLLSVLMSVSKSHLIPEGYYVAQGFAVADKGLPPVIKFEICNVSMVEFRDEFTPEMMFYALASWSIFECNQLHPFANKSADLHTDKTVQILKGVLEKEESTTADIRYAMETLKVLNHQIPNPAKVAQRLQAIIKKNDSLISIGHALHAAALLKSAGQFAIPLIEDVVAQAEEVDGRMLQWEGGLPVTGLLLTGLFKLSKDKPFSQEQADKFANYLLTRKTVQHPKGVLLLYESLTALTKSKVSPLCFTFVGSPQISKENPIVNIRVSNILGNPIVPKPVCYSEEVKSIAGDAVILKKQQLTTSPNSATEYSLKMDVDPGQYSLGITSGNENAVLTVRVLGPVDLQWLEVGLGDADGSSAPRYTKLNYPGQLPSTLQADSSQHLIVRFALSRSVHQPFLRLSTGKREIIFVAEKDNSNVYKVDVGLAAELTYSALFEMELILGDSIMSNPLRWTFGSIDVKLSATEPKKPAVRARRPEIKHMFRPAEKRPPQAVSMLFTALAAAPLLLLLILWLKLGINLNNFSITALPFHAGLASIFGLFTLFWLQLDMFTTCGWLLPIGGFTFLTGQRVLSKLAKMKK